MHPAHAALCRHPLNDGEPRGISGMLNASILVRVISAKNTTEANRLNRPSAKTTSAVTCRHPDHGTPTVRHPVAQTAGDTPRPYCRYESHHRSRRASGNRKRLQRMVNHQPTAANSATAASRCASLGRPSSANLVTCAARTQPVATGSPVTSRGLACLVISLPRCTAIL